MTYALRVLVALGLSKAAYGLFTPRADTAMAFEMAAGLAAVEEGDDRMRPGATLHLGLGDAFASRIYYYGREFGPVREETYLASFSRRWGLFKSNTLTASLGLAVMDEKTSITYEKAEDKAFDDNEDNYNAGLAFGVAWSLPKTFSPFFMSISWDSHLFPAGLNGLIFLSTGRKQTISLTMGAAI